ncbi:MAG: anthranilate synthase component II [Alteromonadaceae bacterium]|nr:MAG: anthranilate synthase component II [Alteromonadaceae bacterium]
MSDAMNNQPVIFLLDNFDSFTYNLVNDLKMMVAELFVYRNDVPAAVIYQKMCASANEGRRVLLVLSPGPGHPKDSGCMLALITLVKGCFPILGICLGHQALVQESGGEIGSAGEIMHGKTSLISLEDHDIFAGLQNPLYVGRYHSLMATNVPDNLRVIARHQNDSGSIPMAVIDDENRMLGYQFHPESILTTSGSQLLQQSLHYLSRI